MSTYQYQGFEELANLLERYSKGAENVLDGLEVGAKEFIKDALKLPKPMSRIKKAGYTHLVETFAYRTKEKEVEAGWGKYHGPMVEHGTKKMRAQPHLVPLWEKNKERYYKTMLTKLGIET